MSFFKRLFGLEDGGPKARQLSHPRDLRTGDIVTFRYTDQPDISGKEFEVFGINTYIYGELCYPELVLKDRSLNIFYMMVEEEDGEEYLALSKKVSKVDMGHVISPADRSRIVTKGTGVPVTIVSKPGGFEHWLVDRYTKVDDGVKGAFVKGDARYLCDEVLARQERFSSHILEDSSGEYALEVEVYETGETELSVTVYCSIEDIEEMWPGAGE